MCVCVCVFELLFFWFDCLYVAVFVFCLALACSASVFFGRANVFLAKSKRGEKMGRVKRSGVGGGEREEKTPARKHCENKQHPLISRV